MPCYDSLMVLVTVWQRSEEGRRVKEGGRKLEAEGERQALIRAQRTDGVALEAFKDYYLH